jgi:hypothetical protein
MPFDTATQTNPKLSSFASPAVPQFSQEDDGHADPNRLETFAQGCCSTFDLGQKNFTALLNSVTASL